MKVSPQRGGSAGISASKSGVSSGFVCRALEALRRQYRALRIDMIEAKKAAGQTGWWSDVPDGWPEDDFKARKATGEGWWWHLKDQWAEQEWRERG